MRAHSHAIHIADQGGLTELADPPYKGYLFYALEIGGGLAALLLIIRRVAGAGWVLALGVSIGPASGYILSRSIGLPHYADDIGNWTEPLGVASLIVEGSLFGCALIALVADHRVFAAELRGLIHHSSPGTDPNADELFKPARSPHRERRRTPLTGPQPHVPSVPRARRGSQPPPNRPTQRREMARRGGCPGSAP